MKREKVSLVELVFSFGLEKRQQHNATVDRAARIKTPFAAPSKLRNTLLM
jgi:hypothetical protein